MLSRLVVFLFAFSFFFSATLPCQAADQSVTALNLSTSKDERLAYKMHKQGVRQQVPSETLQRLQEAAEVHAQKANLCCEVTTFWEVYLERGNTRHLAGYEVVLDCKDAPSPGLALYFSADSRFLGSYDFGH